eukprot:1941008-Prymnesium_polylepis.1
MRAPALPRRSVHPAASSMPVPSPAPWPPLPCVFSLDPVTTRGVPSSGDACGGGARPHCPVASR